MLGLAIIARDEERSLPRLLASIAGCFDEVALLDTGSQDGTVAVFEAWAGAEAGAHPGFTARVGHREWDDDFAAARNAADALLGTSWRAWADADDELRGAGALRAAVSAAPAGVAAFVAGYEIPPTRGARIRLWRAGAARWECPVHERLVVDGELAALSDEVVLWVHHGDAAEASHAERNLRILRAWLEREPGDPRALAHAGREEASRGRHEQAVAYLRRYAAAAAGWDAERAQVHRQLELSLIALGRPEEAAADAAEVVRAMPEWPDGHLTLAEVALERGDDAAAIAHAERVLELGPPATALLHVPTDYTARPLLLIARARARAARQPA